MTIALTLGWWDLLWIAPLLLVLMFYGYIFTMSVKEQFKQLPPLAQAIAAPPAILSWLLDIVLNVVLLSVLFLEFPKEITMTRRMRRWQQMPTLHPKKAFWAKRVCKVLNLFDPGHC